MADVGSLERMGRELKCPICLSLLSSAASITCNHIFCNGCLMESMKSASSCPVCKVPFGRREIRPAPHMDNLVAVFKSMEAAAGTSVVSTQLAPAPKVADGSECGGNAGTKPERSQKKKAPKKKKNTAKATAASASCPTTKPSISTNKRIQVMPFPESETPVRPKKIRKYHEKESKLNGDVQEDKDKTLNPDRPESPSLSPFFWLREEQEEGGTAETLSEPLSLDTPLRHNAPTFSDIIDSDDEIPTNMTPNSKAVVSEIFDSEIFEWSQRPCSPELHSTPPKNQGKLKSALDQIRETDDGEDMNVGGSFDKFDNESNAPQPVNAEEIKKRKLARARNKKSSKSPSCGKLYTKGSDADHQVTNDPVSMAAKPRQKYSSKKERNASRGRNKVSGNSNRSLCSSDKTETFSPKDGLEVEVSENQLSERIPEKDKHSRRRLEIAGDSAVRTAANKSEQRNKRIRRVSDGVVAEKIRVLSEADNESESLQLHRLIKAHTKHKPLDGSKQNTESNVGSNMPSILPGRCQFNEATCTKSSVKHVSVNNGSTKSIEQSDYAATIRSCTAHNAGLKKRAHKVSKVSCAFCQSDDITEESGEMVHYCNGKQVSAEFNGEASVIHSHKNCLEWAPDVYFEDDSVFNLTTELARSKRIKCACCGIKGAALGCFETSCRKSFHLTCAKLIPECRWDNENFVMLCPLHQSSKLPIETSKLKKKPQRRLAPKGPSQVRPSQDYGNKWTWSSGLPQKWILCCSALSAAEKGIVSEFAKIAGLPISTSWSPSVTHVIASTDLSGACKRTLKFLMAILNGKWVVSIDWVKTCMEHMEPVDEMRFEVSTDVHGTTKGPRLGRQRVINKQPKLFDGIQFYLYGDYTTSYRGYLQDLVVAAGGTVLQRKPVSRNQQKLLDDSSLILIVYSNENQDKAKRKLKDGVDTGCCQADAQALACASGGKVVSSAWIIDSIAACDLQPL